MDVTAMGDKYDITTILVLLGVGYFIYRSRKVAAAIREIPGAVASGQYASPYTRWKYFQPRGLSKWMGW